MPTPSPTLFPHLHDRVEIWETPLLPDRFSNEIRKYPKAGACVTFEGWVRNHNEGKEVVQLAYEAYAPMATKEIQKIIEKTKKKFPVLTIHVYHRTGILNIGDIAVWIGVVGEHRKEAFQACDTVMRELKHRAPIWKKETYLDHSTQWIHCAHSKCAFKTKKGETHGTSQRHLSSPRKMG